LTIRAGGHIWQVELKPNGTVIGRSTSCDVVIDSRDVSRRHARLYQDPAGTWIVEDLNSSNGTFVNGERITSSAISLEDVIEIGPASLSFGMLRKPIKTSFKGAPNITIEDFGTEVFYDKPRLEDCDRQPCPERLAQVKQRLSELTDASSLYREVCVLLAQESKTAAAVFRIPRDALPSLNTLIVLACHFGSSIEDARAEAGCVGYPSHLAFRVSHRLLEAVYSKGQALMSKTIFTCDPQVTISLIDELSPRAILCVPLSSSEQATDLLYLDIPIDERISPSPEEMFAFVQAVAQCAQAVASRLSRGAVRDE
jgi:sigma-B regulation protein RsbU (phosphoserine phosphatase)